MIHGVSEKYGIELYIFHHRLAKAVWVTSHMYDRGVNVTINGAEAINLAFRDWYSLDPRSCSPACLRAPGVEHSNISC